MDRGYDMRQYLLPKEGTFYKANLHCHSSVSDGSLSPAELKAAYQSKGYSILAITDHEWMVPHPELNGPDFLALTAYEMTVRDGKVTTPDNRIIHMNLYAPDSSCTRHICFDPSAAQKSPRSGCGRPKPFRSMRKPIFSGFFTQPHGAETG